MTVKELRNLLWKVDEEAEVYIRYFDKDKSNVAYINKVEEKRTYSANNDSYKPEDIKVIIVAN